MMIGCYWVNGARTDLSDWDSINHCYTTPSSAWDIAVSGGTVYVAGKYDMSACYWTNGVRQNLDLPANHRESRAESVVVSGGIVYVAGWYRDSITLIEQPCYWVNGTRHDLPVPSSPAATKSYATGIAVAGNDVYVAGYYNYRNDGAYADTRQYCYWNNGTRYDLSTGSGMYPERNKITIVDGNVYIMWSASMGFNGANNRYNYSYWKNGVKYTTEYDQSVFRPNAEAITVFDGKVYIAGFTGLSSTDNFGDTTSFYMKDGALTLLPPSRQNGRAYDIIVVENK
jgi:hypothetical protein